MLKNRAAFLFCLIWMLACGDGPSLEYRLGEDGDDPAPGLVSIADLKTRYTGSPVVIKEEISISGRIISRDVNGNFYKTLHVEDATGGIAVRIDLNDYQARYWHGATVVISCNTLSLGSYGGQPQLGYASADGRYETDPIPEDMLASLIRVGDENPEEVMPTVLSIPDLTPRYISCYVRINGVQFTEEERGLTWSEEDADTNRHIIDKSGNILAVRTSRNALFANHILPEGSGFIIGVLGYFNGSYQIILSRAGHASFEEERF